MSAAEDNRRQGEWKVVAIVQWTDAFGSTHSYRTPATAVTVADPLRISIDDDNDWFLPGEGEDVESWYRVNRDAHVTAAIVDDQGHAVRTFSDEDQTGGEEHDVSWDGRGDGHSVHVDCPPPEEGDDPIDPGTRRTATSGSRATSSPPATTACASRGQRQRGEDRHPPIHLERRPAGELLTPHDGDTLARSQELVVRAADDYPQDVIWVDYEVTDSSGDTVWERASAGPDGLWRTALDTSGLANGPAEVTYGVAFGVDWGELGWHMTHQWTGHANVTISDVAPQVAFDADQTHGDAPLASAFTLHATDSVGALDYAVTYGDGSTDSGSIDAPYAPLTLNHTYTDPGVYHAHVAVTDQDGNGAQRTLEVVVTGVPVGVPSTGTLEIRTATSPADDDGRFNVFIDNVRKRAATPDGQLRLAHRRRQRRRRDVDAQLRPVDLCVDGPIGRVDRPRQCAERHRRRAAVRSSAPRSTRASSPRSRCACAARAPARSRARRPGSAARHVPDDVPARERGAPDRRAGRRIDLPRLGGHPRVQRPRRLHGQHGHRPRRLRPLRDGRRQGDRR